MPTYQDPGCFCKCCCPLCAVYQAKGCACPDMCFAYIFSACCYTMFFWDPTSGNPNPPGTTVVIVQGGAGPASVVPAGSPSDVEMAR